MATIEEIKQQAAAVKNATQVGENTAMRVGGALSGLAEIAKEQEDNIRKKADKTDMDVELGKKFDKESVVQESGEAEDKVMSQKVVSDKLSNLTELSRFYNVNLFSIQNLYDINAIVPLFGLYYSTRLKAVVPRDSKYDSYCIKVIEGASYTIANITKVGAALGFANYPFLGTKETPTELYIKDGYVVPQGITYILINVAVENIQENPRFYVSDRFATKSIAFTNAYKDGQRDSIEETGTYINKATNPAILFVRKEYSLNKIWQYEITTMNEGSPAMRARYKEVGGDWTAWVTMNSIYMFLQKYNDGFVTTSKLEETTSKLEETDRLYFHNFLLKPGWIGSKGIISQTQWENCYSFLLGVKEGDIIGYTNGNQYAFLTKNIEFVNGALAPLVDGTSREQYKNKDDIVIPKTCKYLWISGHYQDQDSVSNNGFDFLPDTITINGATYNIKDGKDATIPNLVDKVNALEEKSQEIYPKGILKYSSSNKSFQFFMYRGTSNLYFSITMTLKTNNSDEVYLNEYRWTDGGLYSYTNGIFKRVASTMIDVENEMAMKFNNSIDYTGGVHGDERIDIDPKSFVHFFADGMLLSEERLSKDFTMKCSEFSYIQYSTLHETKGITSKEDSEHPIIAHHLKHNIFKDCASFLDNTVKFDIEDYDYSNLKVDQYHATIACVAKGGATTTLLPDFVVVDTSKGTNTQTSANNPNNAKTIQWNNTTGIKILTEGHFTEGLSDDMKNNPSGTPVFVVWDRTNDSKIYRRYHNLNKTISKGYTIRNHQEIHFS